MLLGLDLSTDGGFGRPTVLGLLVLGLALLALFFVIERRQGIRHCSRRTFCATGSFPRRA